MFQRIPFRIDGVVLGARVITGTERGRLVIASGLCIILVVPMTVTRGGPQTQREKGRDPPERKEMGLYAPRGRRVEVVGRIGRFGVVAVVGLFGRSFREGGLRRTQAPRETD